MKCFSARCLWRAFALLTIFCIAAALAWKAWPRALEVARPILCSAYVPDANGRVFHVDPARGSAAGDGTAQRPWRTLQEVVEAGLISQERYGVPHSFRPRAILGAARGGRWPALDGAQVRANPRARIGDGDTVLLYSGDHGDVRIAGHVNRGFVTIAAAEGAVARLGSLSIEGSSHFALSGLQVGGRQLPPGMPLVRLQANDYSGPVDNIVLDSLTVTSDRNIARVDPVEWSRTAPAGIDIRGSCIQVVDSHVHDVRFGIRTYLSRDILLDGNRVENFSVDGIDISGIDIKVTGNLITGHWPNGDDLHPDCIQGQAPPGAPQFGGISIERNICLVETPDGLRNGGLPVQGIVSFEGRWSDWDVRCNLVITAAQHGIALYGVADARIAHNVVLGLPGGDPVWIAALPTKSGRSPARNVIEGNLATAYLNAANGSFPSSIRTMQDLRVFDDPIIRKAILDGFTGVDLRRNRLAILPGQRRSQPADPRLEDTHLETETGPTAAALASVSLPAACAESEQPGA